MESREPEVRGTGQVVADLGLTADELLVCTVLQQVLLTRDLIAETNPAAAAAKLRYRNDFAGAATVAHWSRQDLPRWACNPAQAIAERVPAQQRAAVEAAAAAFGAEISTRSRALLVLVELVSYRPWDDPVRWVARARRASLTAVAAYMPALRPGDIDAVTGEFDAVLRALARRQVRWGRVAVAAGAGLVLGVATAGAAAPLIGAGIGGALGLSGAAATSAGLAALGGGSLAAGGFGVTGGTALVAGLGALGGAGAGAVGSRVGGWSSGQVVAAAVKLDVITRLVVLGAENDEDKARLVVAGMQARLDEVTVRIGRLAEQLRRLTTENTRLTAENTVLRERLRREQDEAQTAQTALQVVLDRIPVTA